MPKKKDIREILKNRLQNMFTDYLQGFAFDTFGVCSSAAINRSHLA